MNPKADNMNEIKKIDYKYRIPSLRGARGVFFIFTLKV